MKTIKINTALHSEKYIPTLVQLQPKMNLRKLAKVQALVRGWIVRREVKQKKYDLVGCFTMQVQGLFFQIKVHHLDDGKVMITVQHPKDKTNLHQKTFGHLP